MRKLMLLHLLNKAKKEPEIFIKKEGSKKAVFTEAWKIVGLSPVTNIDLIYLSSNRITQDELLMKAA